MKVIITLITCLFSASSILATSDTIMFANLSINTEWQYQYNYHYYYLYFQDKYIKINKTLTLIDTHTTSNGNLALSYLVRDSGCVVIKRYPPYPQIYDSTYVDSSYLFVKYGNIPTISVPDSFYSIASISLSDPFSSVSSDPTFFYDKIIPASGILIDKNNTCCRVYELKDSLRLYSSIKLHSETSIRYLENCGLYSYYDRYTCISSACGNKELSIQLTSYNGQAITSLERPNHLSVYTKRPQIHLTVAPNPFNISINISYDIPINETALLKIFSSTGQQLFSKQIIGNGRYIWNALNTANGIYVCRIEHNGYTYSKHLIVNK